MEIVCSQEAPIEPFFHGTEKVATQQHKLYPDDDDELSSKDPLLYES